MKYVLYKQEPNLTEFWQVISPNMYNMKLWETSGHAANYKENMFLIDVSFLHSFSLSSSIKCEKYVFILLSMHGRVSSVAGLINLNSFGYGPFGKDDHSYTH